MDETGRNIYQSPPLNEDEYFVVKWDAATSKWQVICIMPSLDFNAVVWTSTVATTPKPPTVATGNWTFTPDWTALGCTASTIPLSGDLSSGQTNTAPTLSGGPYSFTGINTSTTSSGVLVSTILAGLTYADQDVADQSGIAITASSGSGTWQYSTDNTTWTGVLTVSGSAALLLSAGTYVRYIASTSGETASITFRGWDRTSGTASSNGTRRTADVSTNGGATPYSSGTATANMVVSAISSNANLSGLTPGSGSLSPTFSSSTTSYVLHVASAVSSIQVTPTVADVTATVKVNNITVTSGSLSSAVSLTAGNYTTITTVVTAQDGTTTKTYTISVYRENVTPGNALNFEGTASSKDYVTIANTGNKLDIGSNTITLEAWIKPVRKTDATHEGTSSDNKWNTLFMKGNYGYGLVIGDDNCQATATGKLGYWGQNACTNVPFSTKTIDYGHWNHVAVSINNGNLTFYINGEAAGTATGVSVPTGGVGTALYLGVQDGASGGNGVFYGSMDELRIWSTARTASEIKTNMYNEVSASSTGLVAYYRFEEGVSGGTNTGNTTLYDATSNGLNGTLTNFGLTGSEGNWVESYAMAIPQLNVTSSITTTGFNASWSAPAAGTVNKYVMDISTSSDFSSFITNYNGKDLGTATTESVSGLTSGTTYYYRIRADKTSITGTGAFASLSVTTNTTVTSIVRASGTTPTNATTLNYTVTFANSVTGVDATDFTLMKTGTADGTVGTPTGSGTTWTVPVTGVSGDGTLRLNFTGTTGVTPNVNAQFTSGEVYTLDNTAPNTPTGLSAAAGDQQNTLTWSANSDGDLASYKIYWGTSASPNTLLTTVVSATTFTHTGLTNGTTYYYRISATDNTGNESGKTADITATPKAAQTIAFNALSNVIYGVADITPGATASSGLTVSYQSSNTAVATIVAGKIHVVGAGNTTITASQAGNAAYLAATDKAQTLTVAKKDIILTLNATPTITKTYNASIAATLVASNFALSGIEGTDVVTVSGSATYDTKETGTGKTITVNSFALAGAQKDNYNLTTTSATTTGNITTKPVTLTLNATPVITKPYDGGVTATLVASNYALSGIESGDVVTVTGTASYNTKDAGTGKTITVNNFVLSGAQKDNYNLSTTTANVTGTITSMSVSVTADAKNKTYGDADPAFTYSFTPVLITGDVFSGALTRTAGESAGTYTIQQGTLSLTSNYTLNYIPADLTIGKRTIAVTADTKNKTYGDSDPALTYGFTPALVTGDAFTGSLSRTAGENAGTYTIQQGTLALSTNYTINYTAADLTIGKKTITVNAAAKTKTYGDTDPAFTYTSSPALVTGDAFTGSLSRTTGEAVGTYAIQQGSLSLPANYTLSYTPANLTIGKKTINVTAVAASKTYGDADPAFTYTFTPTLVTGDVFSGALTRTAGESVGTHAIQQGTLSLPGNYTLAYASANLTINPSANANLSALALSKGTLSPVFAAATTSYSATVSNTVTSITLTPTAAMDVSVIKVNGTTVASGTASGNIPLALGDNTLTIAVTAQDGTTVKNYTVTVTRIAVSSNADLAALAVGTGTLTPAFHSDSLSYIVPIAQNISAVTFTPTAAEPASAIKVNGGVVASGTLTTLTSGGDVTTAVIEVTAEDGVTKKTYTVKFIKPVTTWTGAASNAWTDAGNWTNGIPDLIKLTVIANVATRPLVSSNQSVTNITVNNGAAVTLNGNLQIAGSLVNNGTFSGTGTLVLNGAAAQTISGQGFIGNITDNNANGVAIASGTGNTQNITGVLTIAAGTLATNNNLVLKSTAAGTASVAPLPAGTAITGLVTMERWMEAQRGYRALGHPFNSALPLSQLSDDFSISGSGSGFVTGLGYSTASVSYYDSVAIAPVFFKKPLSNAPNTSSTPLWSVGRGILALVRGKGTEGLGGTYPDVSQPSAFAANATGVLNQGALEYKLGANAPGNSFNLVGNPYPAPINIKLLRSNGGVALSSNNGASGVANTIYVYNPYKNAGISSTPSQEVRGGIDAYTNDGTTDIIIPAFGAFFVQAKAPGNIIAFSENVKAAGATPVAVMGGNNAKRLTLSVENNKGTWDDIKIRWDKASDAAATDAYDGVKMTNELLDAYTIASDSKKLCIDSRSDSFNREEIIPLGISTAVQDASFRFRVSAYDLPSNVRIYLRDKLMNTETLLSAVNDSYAFAITGDSLTKGDKRFELGIRFSKETGTVSEDVSAEVKVVPNPFREQLVIQLGTRARSAKTTHVRLVTMNGRVVRTVDAAPNADVIRMHTADLAAGAYIVEVINDVTRVTKQVIRAGNN